MTWSGGFAPPPQQKMGVFMGRSKKSYENPYFVSSHFKGHKNTKLTIYPQIKFPRV